MIGDVVQSKGSRCSSAERHVEPAFIRPIADKIHAHGIYELDTVS